MTSAEGSLREGRANALRCPPRAPKVCSAGEARKRRPPLSPLPSARSPDGDQDRRYCAETATLDAGHGAADTDRRGSRGGVAE